jgi:ribokinase
MAKSAVIVAGSINMDLVVVSERLPKAGETVLGGTFCQNPGGKGANQAVACARLGIDTRFISAVGDDSFGKELLSTLKKYKVVTKFVKTVKKVSSGTAIIGVDKSAENQIIVAPGANYCISPADIKKSAMAFKGASVLLLQLEIPMETVLTAGKAGKKAGLKVVLNPAPACKIPEEIFPMLDYIIPNQTESGLLSGVKVTDNASTIKAAQKLLHKGVGNVLVTLGSKGVMLVNKDGVKSFTANKVKAVDTTAAGDAFCGGLCSALAMGYTQEEAIQFAQKVGALAVTKQGAQQSMPSLAEVKKFAASLKKDK